MYEWKNTQERGTTFLQRTRLGRDKCWNAMNGHIIRAHTRMAALPEQIPEKLREAKGQGTTEYAILVGVLVVIAIIAVVAFRDRLQELWESISGGINDL